MSGRDIRAGRAFVELAVRKEGLVQGLAAALDNAKKQLRSMGAAMTALGSNMFRVGTVIAGTFGAIAASMAHPIRAAGDLMETTSKFQAVFGEATGQMLQFADTYSNVVGRAKSETMASLATMQSFFLGMGLEPEKAAAFAKQMAAASVDFASFHNLTDTEAMQRFISALSGSGEVLSMFGVNIMQAALDQQLLAMGFKKSTAGASEMEKVLARIAIIQKTMEKQGATGDAVKTAGSFSNQMKALRGSAISAAETIGNALLPVITPLVTEAARIVKMFAAWIQQNQGIVVSVAKIAAIGTAAGLAIAGLGAAITAGGIALGVLGTVLAAVKVAILAVAAGFSMLLTPVGLVGAALAASAVYWVRYSESGQRAFSAILDVIRPFATVASDAIKGVKDAFAAGDLGAAAKIAMTALHLAFEMGKANLIHVWFEFRDQVAGVWDSFVVEASAAVAFMGAIWSRWLQTVMDTAWVKGTLAAWEVFKFGAIAVLQEVKSYAEALVTVFDAVRAAILKTAIDTAKVMPAVALAAAQIGNPEAVAKIQVAKVGIDALINEGNVAAQDAREKVGDQRNVLREKRERAGDDVRNEAGFRIASLEQKLAQLNIEAADKLAKLGAKKEEERKAVAEKLPEKPAEEKDKKIGRMDATFSAAAAIAMGRGGGSDGRNNPAQVAKAAADEAKQQRERQILEQRELRREMNEAVFLLNQVARNTKDPVARFA